ncbi:unnamed protein product [Victoria cruziana]
MPDLGSLCEPLGPSDDPPVKNQLLGFPPPCADYLENICLPNGLTAAETISPVSADVAKVCNGKNELVVSGDGGFDGKAPSGINGCLENGGGAAGNGRRVVLSRAGRNSGGRSLEEHVRLWIMKKVASGASEEECRLPFLVHSPRMVECRICGKPVASGMDILCSVRDCGQKYHTTCARKKIGFSAAKDFKCPQHSCFLCKQKGYWRCLVCAMAAHSKCSPWPEAVVLPKDKPGRAICWRHPPDWRLQEKLEDPTNDVEEVFHRLPIPYSEEDFRIDVAQSGTLNNELGPAPYVHIKRNVYLIKKKRDTSDFGTGCTNCDANASCAEDCECRVQCISCSRKCHCAEKCTNRPFRKEKRLKIVKTRFCGWGVESAEPIKKGEFLIEYIGEVIDDAICEARLWDIKYRGDKNFYMCEIRKDFIIDATFKGNASRFLNHSCDPNCKLEKWQVDGETRVGVFASKGIEVGVPLTYDYRFVHFGHYIECCCGASNCQGYLGSKKRTDRVGVISDWGFKRKRREDIHDEARFVVASVTSNLLYEWHRFLV